MIPTLHLGGLGLRRGAAAPSVTYAIWNSADKAAGLTLSGGDLTCTRDATAGAHALVRANLAKAAGKHYIEIKFVTANAAGDWAVGFTASGDPTNTYPGSATVHAQSTGFFPDWPVDARKYKGGTGTDLSGYGRLSATNTYVYIAIDFDAGKVWYKNSSAGSWAGGGDPAAGTSPTYTFTAGTSLFPSLDEYDDPVSCTANFGASAFNGTVPSGFNAGWYT